MPPAGPVWAAERRPTALTTGGSNPSAKGNGAAVNPRPAHRDNGYIQFVLAGLVLLGALALLFQGVWHPGYTLFSNDGPLGRLASACHRYPERFTGCWGDLNGIGFNNGASPPGISTGLQALLKPVWFSKLYPLASLLVLGLGAWTFFNQLRLHRVAGWLGALAAAMNSCFFSAACWGVGAQVMAAGMCFFALAALADPGGRVRWWRSALAGFAVGYGVIEASDVGAIFSLAVAAFALFQARFDDGTGVRRMAGASARLLVTVACAGLVAAQAVIGLVGISIKGIAIEGLASPGGTQLVSSEEDRWDWATQWSLPVRETLSLAVPGIFGYRMETPEGGAYWGAIGQAPAITRYIDEGRLGQMPNGYMRSTGGGFYAGVGVLLAACWGLMQLTRGRESIFNRAQRDWLRFWAALGLVSLLLAYGRFAPFYHFVYAIPGVATIRNPVKFIYLVSLALVVLFAYGMDGLCRKYLAGAAGKAVVGGGGAGWGAFWRRLGRSEKTWLFGCAIFLCVALMLWVEYAAAYQDIVYYLRAMQFGDFSESIARFSIRQIGWFVLFFIAAAVVFGAFFGGFFAGARARWAAAAFGALLFADLGRANLPWIVYWNYQVKYASNPVFDRLRSRAFEGRVTYLPGAHDDRLPDLSQIYNLEWLQQQFPYYNIQTFDIVDMPRKPADFVSYVAANGDSPPAFLRLWRLTNTRYFLGEVSNLDLWKRAVGGADEPFRVVQRFDLAPKSGPANASGLDYWTPVLNDHGPFALFEYGGALPRALLLANWEVQTNDPAALHRLFSSDFDPRSRVLVSGGLAAGRSAASGAGKPGTVEFASYSPRDISLAADAGAPSVLLLNDHYDPNWRVFVDGQAAPLLRCNYIMRGVYLKAGRHAVEFKFQPPFAMLYVSLAAIGISLVVLGAVLLGMASSRSASDSAPHGARVRPVFPGGPRFAAK